MKNIYFALLMFLGTDLYAQKEQDTVVTINEIVINENGFSTPISKQNRNVYVIDSAMIRKLPARTIQELLQYANGIDLRQRGAFGSQADISIDGGSFEQTVVLLDGIKIIDAQTAHNMLNLPIPVEAIERIEVVRGPAARIYGINSLTGAINIVTKRPDISGFLVNLYGGSNFERDSAGTGKTFNGRGIQLGTVLKKETHQHSFFGSHDKSNGYRYNTQFENNKLLYLGHYQLNGSNEVTTSFGYTKNGFGANGFYAAPGDKNSTEVVQTTLASIQSKHYLSKKLTLMPSVSYRYNDDNYRYFGKTNANAGVSKHYTNSMSAGISSSYQTGNGEWALGTELRNEEINSSNIGRHSRKNLGIHSQYRSYLFKNLNVNLGTYVNYNSDYKWQIYPGMDASYLITDMFKIIGNIGTSQRIPSFTDLYLNQRPGNIGNPNLRPESALQGELGFKIINRKLNFNGGFFYRKISKFIDWTRLSSAEPWQSNNFGNMFTKGINMRSSYAITIAYESKLNLNLAYSYLQSQFTDMEPGLMSKYLISSLKHQLTNTIDFQYASFSVLVASRLNQRVSGSSYWINDFRVHQSIDKVTVFLDAQNIFNTTYYEIGAIPLPSRWLSLGVKFSNL
ncbi:MAG: TonB-dependent receptor [Pedobacter sp.]|nr:MAG: TonB-dependent receptor [Pedobacter sp.]